MSQPLIYLTRVSVPSDTTRLIVYRKPERETGFEMALNSLAPQDVAKERTVIGMHRYFPGASPFKPPHPFQRWGYPVLETYMNGIWTQPEIFTGSPKVSTDGNG